MEWPGDYLSALAGKVGDTYVPSGKAWCPKRRT